jgi:hypothetical protein
MILRQGLKSNGNQCCKRPWRLLKASRPGKHTTPMMNELLTKKRARRTSFCSV